MYTFGYIDNSLYTGEITYTAVDTKRGFWGFTSSGYAVGQSKFLDEPFTGIADTGTTLLILTSDLADAYPKSRAPRSSKTTSINSPATSRCPIGPLASSRPKLSFPAAT